MVGYLAYQQKSNETETIWAYCKSNHVCYSKSTENIQKDVGLHKAKTSLGTDDQSLKICLVHPDRSSHTKIDLEKIQTNTLTPSTIDLFGVMHRTIT